MIASAIQNPQAALATVTNMAATYAMQQVGTYVTNITQPLIDQASGFIKDQVSQLAAPITEAFGDLSRNVINEFSASYSTAALQEASFGGLF